MSDARSVVLVSFGSSRVDTLIKKNNMVVTRRATKQQVLLEESCNDGATTEEVSEELSDAGKANDSASLLSWLFDGKVFVILYIMLVYHFFDNEKQIGGWFREAAMPSNLKRTASNPNFWITVIVLSIEHMCYTYVWKKPEHFQKNIVKVLGSPKGKKGHNREECVPWKNQREEDRRIETVSQNAHAK